MADCPVAGIPMHHQDVGSQGLTQPGHSWSSCCQQAPRRNAWKEASLC